MASLNKYISFGTQKVSFAPKEMLIMINCIFSSRSMMKPVLISSNFFLDPNEHQVRLA